MGSPGVELLGGGSKWRGARPARDSCKWECGGVGSKPWSHPGHRVGAQGPGLGGALSLPGKVSSREDGVQDGGSSDRG